MPRIFISYRRSDSIDISERIYTRLVKAFGRKNVFKDVDDMPAGRNFLAVIERAIIDTDVVLVIIGRGWLNAAHKTGGRRLDDANDYVRHEIAMALRHDKRLIPVIVDRAGVPSRDALPEELRSLVDRHAAFIRHDPDFERDMEWLIKEIAPGNPFGRWITLAGGLAALMLAAVLIIPRLNLFPAVTPTSLAAGLPTESQTAEVTAEMLDLPELTQVLTVTPSDTPTETPSDTPTNTPTSTVTVTSTPSQTMRPLIPEPTQLPESTEIPTTTQQPESTEIPTATATSTPSHTATPTSAVEGASGVAAVIGGSGGNGVNLRSGPGTNYAVLGQVEDGTSFDVIAQIGNGNQGWYLLEDGEGQRVWVWAPLVEINPTDALIAAPATIPPTPSVNPNIGISRSGRLYIPSFIYFTKSFTLTGTQLGLRIAFSPAPQTVGCSVDVRVEDVVHSAYTIIWQTEVFDQSLNTTVTLPATGEYRLTMFLSVVPDCPGVDYTVSLFGTGIQFLDQPNDFP